MGTPTHDSHAHSRLDSCCWRLTRPVSGSVKWANHSPGMYWEASVLEDVLEGGAVDSEGIPGRGPWLTLPVSLPHLQKAPSYRTFVFLQI